MTEAAVGDIERRAASLRRHVIRQAAGKGEGYVGQGMQSADIFAALFFNEMNWSGQRLDDPERDRFLLSVGHYAIALYAVLAEAGALSEEQLSTYGADGSHLTLGAEPGDVPGVEFAGGSLGQGLGVGAGLQLHVGRRAAGGCSLGGGDVRCSCRAHQPGQHRRRQPDSGGRAVGPRGLAGGREVPGVRVACPRRRRSRHTGAVECASCGTGAERAAVLSRRAHDHRPGIGDAPFEAARALRSHQARRLGAGHDRGRSVRRVRGGQFMTETERTLVQPDAPVRGATPPDGAAAQMGMSPRGSGFSRALLAAAETRPEVVGVTADLARYTDMMEFARRHPDRMINVGMAEQNLVAVSAGLAMAGLVPVATTFATFLTRRAQDFTVMQVALPQLPVVLVGCVPGITQAFGPSHASIDDLAAMRATPGMTVIDPCDPVEQEQATAAALGMGRPVYLRKLVGREPVLLDPDRHPFRIGKATTLRAGGDVAIVASSIMVKEALEAADRLQQSGVAASVTNVSTLKPFDEDTILELAERCGAVVTAENHSVVGGLFSAVSETLARAGVRAMVQPVGVQDEYPDFGSVEHLQVRHGLTSQAVVAAAESVLQRRDARDVTTKGT